nr:EOG090X08TI [Ilyocryptus agilis]
MDMSLGESVRGMTELDRTKFFKCVSVPAVRVPNCNVGKSMKIFKKFLLKLAMVKPVVESGSEHKLVLLDPLIFKGFTQLESQEKANLSLLEVTCESFLETSVNLTYDNFKMEDVLKMVLPEGKEGCTAYSRVGHIVHVNLRDHLLPYKSLIGEVMLDKLIGVRTVVNKSQTIDSTYRNFQMEILAGEADFVAQVKENSCVFKFDFSKVYWNSRLCTEHERIIKTLPQGSVLFDVFAGVGPFAVPAAKIRGCRVFANDLNPHSYEWLKENIRHNKVKNIEAFNLDGREFIGQHLKNFLLSRSREPIHVTMNLPALAVEFLDSFVGLLASDALETSSLIESSLLNLTVHVYSFCADASAAAEMRKKVESSLRFSLSDDQIVEIIDVRDVSPKKHMLRMSFRMPRDVLFKHCTSALDGAPEPKRIKLLNSPQQSSEAGL